MAIQLANGETDTTFANGDTVLCHGLQCYDTIGDPDFDFERDELLHIRSYFEFMRHALNDTQKSELDMVDNYWRTNADDFNQDFSSFHHLHYATKKLEMRGFGLIDDNTGLPPEITRDHWWWWPLNNIGASQHILKDVYHILDRKLAEIFATENHLPKKYYARFLFYLTEYDIMIDICSGFMMEHIGLDCDERKIIPLSGKDADYLAQAIETDFPFLKFT